MSEQSNDITIINPSGREVVVPNELAQDLLLQPGYRVKPADEPNEAPKQDEAKTEATAPAAPADEPNEAPKPRSRASK